MEQTGEKSAARLLDGVTDIIRRYQARWQQTGEQFNLFKVAGITDDEVKICRVLADILNPRGKHCKGSLFLRLFWETIAPKLRDCPALDIERTKVTPEYVIDENRRIDIALDDGSVFVPVEVKIRAGDQPKQVADYFAYARTKNKAAVPVLYLTLDGHEPPEFSKADAGKDAYVSLSFRDDMLPWLEACLREEAVEKTVPVRENLKQLIAAIKSLYGKPEDAEMEHEIFKLVTQSDDTGRAALAISGVTDFGGKALEAFKGPITGRVIKRWPDAFYDAEADGWYYISLPLKKERFFLTINYLWDKVSIQAAPDAKGVTTEEKNALYESMSGLFSLHPKPNDKFVWYSDGLSWPSFARDELYKFHLCKFYTEYPQEAADKMIGIAGELESVKV
jgi:hypothetical protein